MQLSLSTNNLSTTLPVLPKQVASILRKFGANAHLYMPGVGTLNGFSAGNYLESTGNTNASVDGAVGLVLDAAGSVGADKTPVGTVWQGFNANLSSTTLPATATQTGSINYGLRLLSFLTVGKTYRVTVSWSGNVSGRVIKVDAAGSTNLGSSVSGTGSAIFTATDVAHYIYAASAAGGETFTIVSVKTEEITGTHATQATTANKPTLRRVGNAYAWQFDGSNDVLALSGPLFQMADDHCVVAAFNASSANGDIFSVSNSGTTSPLVGRLLLSSNVVTGFWRDDAGTFSQQASGSVPTGSNGVAALRQVGNTRTCWTNGVVGTTETKSLGATAVNTSSIGARNNGSLNSFYNGLLYPVIVIKGTVSDAELKILEKWLGSLAGVVVS